MQFFPSSSSCRYLNRRPPISGEGNLRNYQTFQLCPTSTSRNLTEQIESFLHSLLSASSSRSTRTSELPGATRFSSHISFAKDPEKHTILCILYTLCGLVGEEATLHFGSRISYQLGERVNQGDFTTRYRDKDIERHPRIEDLAGSISPSREWCASSLAHHHWFHGC